MENHNKKGPNKKKGPNPPTVFQHPTFGRCERDPTRAAIRWHPHTGVVAKEQLLDQLDLDYAALPTQGDRPLLQVNQTDGLSWVQSPDGAALTDDQLRDLAGSELVEWVSSAYRADRSDPTVPALFCVNPSRLYIRQDDADVTESLGAVGAAVAVDPDAPVRIRGYQTLRVEAPSVADGGAILVAQRLAREVTRKAGGPKTSVVRLENIPYLSPTTHVATPPSMPATSTFTPDVEHLGPPISEFTPNDPDFASQWGLQRINAPRGWEIARGTPNIAVAVIDEGVELGHPDLDLHPQSWNASTDMPDGSPTGAHGTACAGIIGARLNNMAGVAGVAGGVRTMAIATATWADVDIVDGLYFAADHGARVVSMSFGVYPSWMMWDFDLIRDALQYAHDRGLVLVAASGNENLAQSRFPGSDARTITVGGSNRSDERKRIGDASSEPVWGACYGDDVDVVAPCLEIPTTDQLGGAGYAAGDYYNRFNGTSAATPHVAGLAALIFSMRPALASAQVRSIIETTCDKISPAMYVYANVSSKPHGTWNDEVGYGRINVERALLAVRALTGNGFQRECTGCGGACIEEIPADCRGPHPVPWLSHDHCMYFYETRTFDANRLQIRITYEHCLRLLGRQQGPLLYTQTLLPGEEVRLFYFERYRRVRAQSERLSVHSSFRQTLSALSQSRRSTSASAYADTLARTRSEADASISVGGGLAGFFGGPSGSFDTSTESETTLASGGSVRAVAEQFAEFAVTASQALEAERSIVISSFEEQDHQATAQRTFKNDNRCYAVTYYIRRVNEAYQATSRVVAVEWRLSPNAPFRSTGDLADVPNELQKRLQEVLRQVPLPGESLTDRRLITIPTDGTLYEAEFSYCSSCEPIHDAEMRIDLERRRLDTRRSCLETEALSLEVERRRWLLEQGSALTPLGAGTTAALPPVTGTTPPALAAQGMTEAILGG